MQLNVYIRLYLSLSFLMEDEALIFCRALTLESYFYVLINQLRVYT